MEASTTSRGRLRRLAELRPDKGLVLSLYFDLDPAEFATAPARASQITSVLDEAAKLIEQRDDLEHEEKAGLREDVERVRRLFDPQSMGSGGVRGIAVFACAPCDVLEIIRTPFPVESRVVINHTPHIEPLAAAGDRERWCVVLVSRRDGRIFFGDQDGFEEFENVHDDTLNQQQQGGWSQRRYEESQEGEKRDHLDNVGSRLLELVRAKPFDRLVIGGPEPIDTEFEQRLHPYVKERLVDGRVRVDVEVATPADVLTAATPVFEEHRREKERQAIERLRAGLGRGADGRAVAGLHGVLDALNQQRVEVLLLEPRVGKRGWLDPDTNFLSAEPGTGPSGSELVEQEDVVELAIERAVEQSAEVMLLRDQPDLGPHGGVAALLRF